MAAEGRGKCGNHQAAYGPRTRRVARLERAHRACARRTSLATLGRFFMQFTRRQVCAAALAVSARAVLGQSSQSTSIDEFFTSFTDEWMRANPGLASSTRYFSGEIQDRLDR